MPSAPSTSGRCHSMCEAWKIAVKVREEFAAARLFPTESRTKLIFFKRDEKKSVLMLEMLF